MPAPSCYSQPLTPSSIITTCSSTLSRRCRMRFLCWLHLILSTPPPAPPQLIPSLTAWSLRMTGIVINLSNSRSFGHSRQSSSVAITSVRFLFLFFFLQLCSHRFVSDLYFLLREESCALDFSGKDSFVRL